MRLFKRKLTAKDIRQIAVVLQPAYNKVEDLKQYATITNCIKKKVTENPLIDHLVFDAVRTGTMAMLSDPKNGFTVKEMNWRTNGLPTIEIKWNR
jgi:hypothetical protein